MEPLTSETMVLCLHNAGFWEKSQESGRLNIWAWRVTGAFVCLKSAADTCHGNQGATDHAASQAIWTWPAVELDGTAPEVEVSNCITRCMGVFGTRVVSCTH
jgi:hypothetical protein